MSGISDIFGFNIRPASYEGNAGYRVGHTYTATVTTALVDINGNHLGQPYSFSYTPEPVLRVTRVYPADASNTVFSSSTDVIRLTFNSPMTMNLASRIQVSPPTAGEWHFGEYDDSTVIRFTSSRPLSYATTYTVQVPAGVVDRFGNAMPTPFISTFRTREFAVTYLYPEDGSGNISPTSTIYVQFSGRVDTASVRAGFSLAPASAGIMSFYSSGQLMFTPTLGFAPSTAYLLTIAPTVRASDGTLLGAPVTSRFTTRSFQVLSTYPVDGDSAWSTTNGVSISLNAPIDTSSLRSSFSIEPAQAGYLTTANYNPSMIVFSPDVFFPSATWFTITIRSTLRAAAGGTLGTDYQLRFRTEPFRIVSMFPAEGEINVSRYSSVSVTCNEYIDAQTIPPAFSLRPQTAGGVVASSGGFTFLPPQGFAPHTLYTATVSTALRNNRGIPLSIPRTVNFITGP
jgi:hypothetical protein